MTPEKEELLRKLQGVFKRKIEKPQVGDRLISIKRNKLEYIISLFPSKFPFDTNFKNKCRYEDYYLYPHVYSIDLNNPHRGLWGMIDWKKIKLAIHEDYVIGYNQYDMSYLFEGDLEIVLLKIIAHQNEIK